MLIVDDHDVVHWGFRLMLGNQPWVERSLSSRSGEEAYALAERYKPDVALVDLFIGEDPAPRCLSSCASAHPDQRAADLWRRADLPGAAKAAGASGFIPKDWGAADVSRAVRMVGLG